MKNIHRNLFFSTLYTLNKTGELTVRTLSPREIVEALNLEFNAKESIRVYQALKNKGLKPLVIKKGYKSNVTYTINLEAFKKELEKVNEKKYQIIEVYPVAANV